MIVNGDCYFTRECEALGVPLLVTPIPSFKEQGLEEGKNCYYIPFDVEKFDVKKIVNKIPQYEGYIKEDGWKKILAKGKTKYKKILKDIRVKATMDFTIQDFDELEKIERANRFKHSEGYIYKGDTFNIDITMYEYLTTRPNLPPLVEKI